MTSEQYLNDEEIEEFLNELDTNNDGFIEYSEVEHKLDEVHQVLAPVPRSHNLHHKDREDVQRHVFLRSMMGTDKNRIPRKEFEGIVETWKIPSMSPEKKADEDSTEYMNKMSFPRRARAIWNVRGPEIVFLGVVVGLMIGMGTWQLVKYVTGPYTAALGWGVVLAKTSAGVLYPTFFFLILSMSRYVATFARKSYYLSRFINWDLHQSFHIWMSIVALFFATTHAIGHLTGSFLYGSRAAQQQQVTMQLGAPMSYRDYVSLLPGWSGITMLGLFYILALLSMPIVRKWNYEVFQLGHLLMFPIIGLLFAHGTRQLLQFYMMGYWIALPTILVVAERLLRVINGFVAIGATIEILDDDTVAITATVPQHRYWPYKAGQYIFLQVPVLSRWQWHPFTISTCIENELSLHIKTDGDWTSKLRDLVRNGEPQQIVIGVDGPFGAPAQRFYDFDHSIVLGSGIGVTPFSGVLADLQAREKRRVAAQSPGDISPDAITLTEKLAAQDQYLEQPRYRRVDFHWIVKDKNYLLWFSDLLNDISRSSMAHSSDSSPHLDVNIVTHVTQKRKNISTYIYRYLLECHRTDEHPASALTGLINKTHFGRPDLAGIMDEHYEMMLKYCRGRVEEKGTDEIKRRKVGVFFCGAPPIGYELADRCRILTLRGREDRSLVEYHFMMEVFG